MTTMMALIMKTIQDGHKCWIISSYAQLSIFLSIFISVFELVNISIFVFVFVNVSKLFHHTTVATLVLMEFNRLICQNQSNTDWLVNI